MHSAPPSTYAGRGRKLSARQVTTAGSQNPRGQAPKREVIMDGIHGLLGA
jgi:hypothetical protein